MNSTEVKNPDIPILIFLSLMIIWLVAYRNTRLSIEVKSLPTLHHSSVWVAPSMWGTTTAFGGRNDRLVQTPGIPGDFLSFTKTGVFWCSY